MDPKKRVELVQKEPNPIHKLGTAHGNDDNFERKPHKITCKEGMWPTIIIF